MSLCLEIILFALFTIITCVRSEIKPKCPGLKFSGEITCISASGNGGLMSNCESEQNVGTIAEYKCKRNFALQENQEYKLIPRQEPFGIMECNINGTWSGYHIFQAIRCKEQCGKRGITNSKPLIVNGVPANTTSWPWHAILFRPKGKTMEYICGGTLISSSAVMTAAHCASEHVNSLIHKKAPLVVILGATSSNFSENRPENGAQIFQVKRIFISEHYDERKDFQADIAILELNGVTEHNDFVTTACLPNDFTMDSNAIKPGRIGDVVGFGVDENQQISAILKHGQLEINSHSECFIYLEQTLSSSQFCAGSRKGNIWETVCNGDSGGGLYIPSLIDEKYYVHGIVSTGKFSCQNFGVFTRVHSFTPWVRNILEQIGEEIDSPEFDLNDGFQYVLNGTENHRIQFYPIPIELKNKITLIQLTHIDIDPNLFLKSLEYCKTVRVLNLTNVRFTKRFPNTRVRLPYLKSFSLDILTRNYLHFNSSVPTFSFNNFVRSLKFFEKSANADDSSDITEIASGQVNVFITAGIYKLIEIHHEKGKISLSKIDFTNEILANILGKSASFELRHLALSSTEVDLSNLPKTAMANLKKLKNLILDNISNLEKNLLRLLKDSQELELLVVSGASGDENENIRVQISSLPKSLKYLSLDQIKINLGSSATINNYNLPRRKPTRPPSSKLFFDPIPSYVQNHDSSRYGDIRSFKHRNNNRNPDVLTQLETFYCNSCLPPNFLIRQLPELFPNLKHLVISERQQQQLGGTEGLKKFVKEFEQLESFVLLTTDVGCVKLVKQETQWVIVPPKLNLWNAEKNHLDFMYNHRHKFYIGEPDYVSSTRLTSVERSAFETGLYKFDGRRKFSTIPIQIQNRLENIEISNGAIINPQNLLDSLRNCTVLKSLRLLNVTALNMGETEAPFLPKLAEYRIEQKLIPLWVGFSYTQFSAVLDSYFIFQFFISEQIPKFNLETTLLQSQLRKIHVQFGECIQASWDSDKGTLVSISRYTNEWLKNTNVSSPAVKKLDLQYIELDHKVIPSSVSQLNLNFVVLKCLDCVLERLTTLKILKLVNVRAGGDSLHTNSWEWPELNLTQLAKLHAPSLTSLTLERVHLRNYNLDVKFRNVRNLYLESCTFETDFVKDFAKIFPNVKKLIFLVKTEGTGDDLLQEALKSESLDWILSDRLTKYNSNATPVMKPNESSESDSEEEEEEDSDEVDNYLVAKRRNGSSSWIIENSDKLNVKNRLLNTKGTKIFGNSPRCYAFNG